MSIDTKSYEYHKKYQKKYAAKFSQVKFTVTPAEHQMIKKMASEAGKSVNQFIKDCIFGSEE